MTDPLASRRALLRGLGSAIAAAALTGCSSVRSGGPTVAVGPDHRLAFAPETVRVPVGTTVTWRWHSDDHNVVASGTPADASWDGTPGDERVVYGVGYSYEATFSTVGTYAYYCHPHLSAGMTGAVVVE